MSNEYRFLDECEKCKELLGILLLPTKFVGGVNAYLCTRCSTEWNRFCAVLPSFQELRRLESIRESIVHAREVHPDSPTHQRLKRVLDEYLEMELELHQVGLEWLGRETV